MYVHTCVYVATYILIIHICLYNYFHTYFSFVASSVTHCLVSVSVSVTITVISDSTSSTIAVVEGATTVNIILSSNMDVLMVRINDSNVIDAIDPNALTMGYFIRANITSQLYNMTITCFIHPDSEATQVEVIATNETNNITNGNA